MTRVVVLPADESACGYYRMKLPAGAVQQIRPDWDIEVYRPTDVKLGSGGAGELWSISGVRDPMSIDLLVMQRVGTPLQHALLRWAANIGTATIVDSDDAMWCIDKGNIAFPSWNGPRNHWSWLDKAAETADLTTVTTPALARRYGKHGRTEVLPNCVPGELEEFLEPIRDAFDPKLTIGWAGFTGTHPGDLKVVGDAVSSLVAEGNVDVRVVGDAKGAARDWGIKEIGEVEPQPIGLPYYTALTSLDIGLVPLRNTPFNQAKSYLKALEMAACGVLVIASDTPANRALSKTVPMWLAETPTDWYRNVQELVGWSPERRAERAAEARQAVFTHHTFEANAEHWAVVWERALARRAKIAV